MLTNGAVSFAEAWYNLVDLLEAIQSAIEFLRENMQVAPDYVDATFNLALLLQRKNQPEAADYWRRYRYRRPTGMSYRARRSLKLCEMQQHLIA
jgi:hypothetical protein